MPLRSGSAAVSQISQNWSKFGGGWYLKKKKRKSHKKEAAETKPCLPARGCFGKLETWGRNAAEKKGALPFEKNHPRGEIAVGLAEWPDANMCSS